MCEYCESPEQAITSVSTSHLIDINGSLTNLLELFTSVTELYDLSWAHEGKVQRICKQDHILFV